MECPRCNERIYRDTRFCPSCGLIVEELVEALAEEEPEEEPEEELNEELDDGLASHHDANQEDQAQELVDNEQEDAAQNEANEPGDNNDQSEGQKDDEPKANEASEGNDLAESKEMPDETDKSEDGSKAEDDTLAGEVSPAKDGHESGDKPAEDGAESNLSSESPSSSNDGGNQSANKGVFALRWATAKEFVLAHKRASIVVGAILACALVVGIVLIAQGAQEARREEEVQAAYEQALNMPRLVTVVLDIDNYDEEHMTPIPLRVVGTSANGESVDEVLLVTPKAPELTVLPGSYSVSLRGKPVSDQGILYDGSIDTFTLEVPVEEQESKDNKGDDEDDKQKELVFVFAPVAPQNVRDADVDEARAWMKEAHIDKADAYADAVANRRNEELERIEQEQANREEEDLKKVEDTTRQIEKEIADSNKKKQQQDGKSNNQQSNSGYDSNNSDYDWYGYDSYDNSYVNSNDWYNSWGY